MSHTTTSPPYQSLAIRTCSTSHHQPTPPKPTTMLPVKTKAVMDTATPGPSHPAAQLLCQAQIVSNKAGHLTANCQPCPCETTACPVSGAQHQSIQPPAACSCSLTTRPIVQGDGSSLPTNKMPCWQNADGLLLLSLLLQHAVVNLLHAAACNPCCTPWMLSDAMLLSTYYFPSGCTQRCLRCCEYGMLPQKKTCSCSCCSTNKKERTHT